ncbi:metalloregulator ArsR/SmtB family transcription factor [Methylosoma difficile]
MLSPLQVFKSLADETRLRCMILLHKEGRLCVCELVTALNMSQPKVSRHLALLRQNQVLLDSREGQWVYYRINPDLSEWVSTVLSAMLLDEEIQPVLNQDFARLQAMEGRPTTTNGESKCCN